MVLRQLGKKPLVREGAPLLGLYWLYSYIRWFVARESPYEAFANAFRIIQWEKQLGMFHEPGIQSWLIDRAMGFVHIANAFYTVGYFPVIIICGILLYRHEPYRFQVFKLTFLLGLGFALICFSLFPLAPPRMLPELGFVDTQQVFGSGLYDHEFVLSLYNPFAAMPSLHFGWTLLVGIVAYSFERRSLKVFGVLYPCCMALVVVTTGHHYFLDVVGGGIIIGLAWAMVKALPTVVKELAPSSAWISSGFPFGEPRPTGRASSHSRTHAVVPWSKEQQDYDRQRRLRSSIIASLINLRPPL